MPLRHLNKKGLRILSAALFAFAPVFLANSAMAATWTGTNVNIGPNCIQFDYRGGTASTTIIVPDDAINAEVSLAINNTIANRIGGGQVADTWSVSINENNFTGNEITSTTVRASVPTGSVRITAAGRDVGFWAGWYGPVICGPELTYETAPVVVPLPVEPEPTNTPLPEQSSQPTPELPQAPETSPSPEPSQAEVQQTPQPSTPPQPVESAAPSPEPQPIPEPIATPEPTPSIEPEPILPQPEETIEPEPTIPPEKEPAPTPEEAEEPAQEPVQEVVDSTPASEPSSPPAATEPSVEQLAQAAEEDDPELPAELAEVPIVGEVLGAVLNVFNDLGNIGADMTPEVREKAEDVAVISIISQVAQTAGVATASAAAASRKNK